MEKTDKFLYRDIISSYNNSSKKECECSNDDLKKRIIYGNRSNFKDNEEKIKYLENKIVSLFEKFGDESDLYNK